MPQRVGEPLCEQSGYKPLDAVVSQTDDSEADADDEEEDAPLVERDPEQLTETERVLDSADRPLLRSIASEVEGVNGNQSETDLRVVLHTHSDEEAVENAVATVVTSDTNDDTDNEES